MTNLLLVFCFTLLWKTVECRASHSEISLRQSNDPASQPDNCIYNCHGKNSGNYVNLIGAII